jgi:hypothetical protein
MMVGLAACCCPKPDTVNQGDLTPAEEAQANSARAQLKAAETKGTWNPDDDEAYSAAIANLPHATRLQLAKDLVGRLNDRKIKFVHRPRTGGPRVCPAMCESRVTTTQTTGTKDVPPGTPVPAPAVGKAVAK